MLGLLPRGYFTVASMVEVEETKPVSATPEESEPKSESSFAAASTYFQPNVSFQSSIPECAAS
jgi:hypothetical protein